MSSRLINLCREIKGLPSSNSVVIDNLINIFTKYGSTGNAVSASLLPIGSSSINYNLRVNYSQVDLISVEKKQFFSDYIVNLQGDDLVNSITHVSSGQGVASELCRISTFDGKLTAIVRDTSKDGKSGQVIEFWSKKGLLKTLDGGKDKSFGTIHLFETFGSPKWSRDGAKLMFIAEKFKTTSGFFGDKKKSDDKNGDKEISEGEDVKTTGQGDEYLIKEDWGEQLEGTCHPMVYIVDLNDDYKIRTIDIPDVSCSEGFWIDNKTIGFVGIKEEPRRLGLIFCPIRKSCLYKCDLRDPESDPVIIFGGNFDQSVRSPRVSNDSSKIVFLVNPSSGPHFGASSLTLLNLKDGQVKTLIDVGSSQLNEPDAPTTFETFYSLYLPKRCWTSDDKKIIVNPELVYRAHIFLVDAENGQRQLIPVEGGQVVSILDFRDDIIVLNLTQPNMGSNIKIGKLKNNQITQLTSVDPDLVVRRDEIDFRCDKILKSDSTNGQQLITCILIGPKESFGKPTPTILIPHGGPHSSFVATYMPRVAIMAEVGFKVILVNYRGSVGINSAHDKILCGKVGELDVADCMEALNYYIDRKEVDKNQVCLYGGSHGGFLVTHLIGQHSEFGFRACCPLNPVTDLAAGFSTSDIPDWHLVEGVGSLESYPLTTLPSSDLLSNLMLRSPIVHIDKVKTPVLMVLGTKDKRVAMCQGLAYYYGLKARGVATKCLVYEDNHSIGKTSHGLDVEMNCLLWLLDHLSPKQ
ncbi:acylamino-acid-releasing enzyme-like [Panonychus citri]|uniref:acylamino-acid-releasing enzyme-like n=1 Tax=Panonychus citri TaxID=50023 RepID=UPI0023075909|nr:acylamino-acid-releasing enzyme-like [Panonychus citri]